MNKRKKRKSPSEIISEMFIREQEENERIPEESQRKQQEYCLKKRKEGKNHS